MIRPHSLLMLRAGAAPTHPTRAVGRTRRNDAAMRTWRREYAPGLAPVG